MSVRRKDDTVSHGFRWRWSSKLLSHRSAYLHSMKEEMVEAALENVRENKAKYIAMGEAGRSEDSISESSE